MSDVAQATTEVVPRPTASRPNLVSVGTIIWLSSELMFFAALFAMYFTIRSATGHDNWPPEPFKPFLSMSAQGGLRDALTHMLANKSFFRSEQALALRRRSLAAR